MFMKYVLNEKIISMNVKEIFTIPNCREWIIDIDSDARDKKVLNLQNNICIQTFILFFKDVRYKMYTSGNRGLHIWLDVDDFSPTATNEERSHYANLFNKNHINISKYNVQNDNSFYKCFTDALQSDIIIPHLYEYMKSLSNVTNQSQHLIDVFFPKIDFGVFTSTKRGCRVPLSYNQKGCKYGVEIITKS
ncbi:late expression factor 1 [Neodiprion sertifer nucleopolyhedrovirus]|uniref:Late expression factor 1 n=1 Tax=Neodiprion sertifer nucleopolyhedrovirus TaxID=111874 RepID=Q6JK92_9CBAC|nr:late expression factor 1 [Neodiprion sertifer nucleopolyhedrovirus]AAQ96445.1 late expression factor 1 [Neodiprion sertifer nucleopolyhedrovirus]